MEGGVKGDGEEEEEVSKGTEGVEGGREGAKKIKSNPPPTDGHAHSPLTFPLTAIKLPPPPPRPANCSKTQLHR